MDFLKTDCFIIMIEALAKDSKKKKGSSIVRVFLVVKKNYSHGF